MTQLVCEGVYLDLYENDPIKVNVVFDDFEFGVVSDYSQTFRVPATKKNNELFKQVFEINDIDFDITQKRKAYLLVNGVEYKEGELRLLKVFLSNDTRNAEYEVIFLGSKKSFQSSVGEKTLCQLNYSDYIHQQSFSAITKSWEAYPSGTTTSGLFSGDCLYALVDFGNTYTGVTGPTEYLSEVPKALYGEIGSYVNSASVYSIHPYFTGTTSPLEHNRFRPMLRVKSVFDKIFSEAGFTYTSEFLSSNFIRNLYVSAWGNEEDYNLEVGSNNCQVFAVVDGTTIGLPEIIQLQFLNQNPVYYNPLVYGSASDPGENWDLDHYTCPLAGTYTGRLELGTWANAQYNQFRIRIHKKSAGVETTISESPLLDGQVIFWINDFTTTASANDEIYVKVYNSGDTQMSITETSTFKILSSPGSVNPGTSLDCDYKQIDFVKDIITKFRMVMVPKGKDNFLIEPWQDIIAQGTIYDWTEKMDHSKDILIEPTFYALKKKITFKDKTDSDIGNVWVLETGPKQLPYGARELVSNYDLLFDEQVIETNFASTINLMPSFFDIGGFSRTQFAYTTIPQIWKGERNIHHYTRERTPFKPRTRILFYNGMANTAAASSGSGAVWYLRNDSAGTQSYSQYPAISSYSSFPISAATDLNWFGQKLYMNRGTPSPRTPSQGSSSTFINPRTDVYDRFWSTYITTLYDKTARRLTAYFKLNFEDIRNLEPGDVIFIKNNYWYISKIFDLVVGEDTLVKVELIKLINYKVPGDNFIPPSLDFWENEAALWEVEASLWES